MGNLRAIWKHELKQADKIARKLLETRNNKSFWRALFPPARLLEYFWSKKDIHRARKNFLFTKRLAFNAARGVSRETSRASEIRVIEIKTKEILDNEKKGFYTEKIRRKQLHEIELLLDHYLALANANAGSYANMIRKAYKSKNRYLTFINKLQKTEQEVIQAAVTSMRKGSKKERVTWFEKVQEASRTNRIEELESIFHEE